jgi:primase-polymerase (primpol)-like protein
MFDPSDEILGVDFDNCLDDHGAIIPGTLAAEWLPRFNSYSECSPSGKGIKTRANASKS